MDVTLQKHCAKYIYVVPEGLHELMSDISREVLRHQPIDLYTFIADYLDALMITRENARIASKLVQYISETSETIVTLLNEIGLTREQADRSAAIIQKAFRDYLEKKTKPTETDEDEIITNILEQMQIDYNIAIKAANIIQIAFRRFKARQQFETRLWSGVIDWRVAARDAIKLYRKTGVTLEEAHRAATLIKAAYKGYYTRRIMGKLAREFEVIDDESSEKGSKAVRIDYSTVIPHVDFDLDAERIGDELTSIEIIQEILEEIVNAAIPPEEDLETFIKNSILNELIRKIVDGEEELTPTEIVYEILEEILNMVTPVDEDDLETFIQKTIIEELIRKIEIDTSSETLEEPTAEESIASVEQSIEDETSIIEMINELQQSGFIITESEEEEMNE